MLCKTKTSGRSGFTLVELLVTIAILGILLGLLLPNLAAVQQTAKAGAQSATLQQFGKGFIDFQSLDREGRFTTSMFDHMRDGDITRIGWVADLVNNKYAVPGQAIDPVNTMTISEKFTDASGARSSADFNNWRWRSVLTKTAAGTVVSTGTDAKGETYFGTTQTVFADGYNAPWATTWHFGRGDNLTSGTGTNTNYFTTDVAADGDSKCPGDADGPLSVDHISGPRFVSQAAKIGLMGAARTGDSGECTLTSDMCNTMNSFADPTGRRRIVKVGDITLESFCDGPAASVDTTSFASGDRSDTEYYQTFNAQVHENNDITANCKQKVTKNSANPNGILAGGYANVLFADGSVRRVEGQRGFEGKGDSWVGAYPATGAVGGDYVFNAEAYEEIRDEWYVGRLRSPIVAGGGSLE